MAITIINRCLTLREFEDYVAAYNFGTEPANKLVLHHTWRPTKEGWARTRTMEGVKKYYEGKGWTAGPHLFVAEDGIWLFSPMRKDGIHAGELNHRSIGIEVVGDYDGEPWSGQTKENALGVIRVLMKHLDIDAAHLFFHSDVSPKSCPGKVITREWLFQELGVDAPTALAGTPDDNEVQIPAWAAESVDWVQLHDLFTITSQQDVRDAVKFHRLYQLLQKEV